jgi:peptidoglycan/xylan/chitin deacetylase (PgdA/CDA1 family)
MYHGLTNQCHATGIENYHGRHLYIKSFSHHLEYLKYHYNIIPLYQFVNYCHGKTGIPSNAVILTFDDGYASNYKLAFPVLKKLKMPATIFVTTEFVDSKKFLLSDRIEYAIGETRSSAFQWPLTGKKLSIDISTDGAKKKAIDDITQQLKDIPTDNRSDIVAKLEEILKIKLMLDSSTPEIYLPLDWTQCKEMIMSGLITIGSHSHTHPVISRCDANSMAREVALSKAIITENTGFCCDLFCYPYGGNAEFNLHSKEILQKTGFVAALTMIKGLNHKRSDLYELNRLGTSNELALCDFKRQLLSSYRFYREYYKYAYQNYLKIKHTLNYW